MTRRLRTAWLVPLLVLAAAGEARAQTDEEPEDPTPLTADPAPPEAEPAPRRRANAATAGEEDGATGGTGTEATGEAGVDAGGAGPAPAGGTEPAPTATHDPAVADEGEAVAEEEDGEPESLDHEYQVGVRIGAGVPFLFALRYADGPPCDADGSNFCLHVGSGIIDVGLSFGITPDLEITTLGRFGMVGVEPTEEIAILLGLGIRSYLSPEGMFKFFLGAQLLLDLTQPGGVSDWGGADFGVRGEFGVQLDIVRYVGLYLQIGVNITFLRSFGVSPDATGGVQIRFP